MRSPRLRGPRTNSRCIRHRHGNRQTVSDRRCLTVLRRQANRNRGTHGCCSMTIVHDSTCFRLAPAPVATPVESPRRQTLLPGSRLGSTGHKSRNEASRDVVNRNEFELVQPDIGITDVERVLIDVEADADGLPEGGSSAERQGASGATAPVGYAFAFSRAKPSPSARFSPGPGVIRKSKSAITTGPAAASGGRSACFESNRSTAGRGGLTRRRNRGGSSASPS